MDEKKTSMRIALVLTFSIGLAAALACAGAAAHDGHTHVGSGAAQNTDADPVERLIDIARRAQARHDFDHALTLIRRAVEMRPVNDDAWLLAASIHLVQGDQNAAEHACRRLRQVPAFVKMTCSARVLIARDRAAAALRLLQAFTSTIEPGRPTSAWFAWAYSVAGDAARVVRPSSAIEYYRGSLELQENTQVRAALTDVLLLLNDTGQAEQVLAVGGDALALRLRRLILAQRSGQQDAFSKQIAAMDKQFQAWIANNNWQHAREMTRFYLDVLPRPALARRLSQINQQIQKEPEDLLLVARLEKTI